MSGDIIEKITSKGINVVFSRSEKPKKLALEFGSELLRFKDMTPPNMLSSESPPLMLLAGDGTSIELSKRREPMPFWHRNMDYDEVIICIKGEAKWSTETGEYNLKEGEMILIPRGVSHTVVANKDTDYTAIEIKSRPQLTVNKELKK